MPDRAKQPRLGLNITSVMLFQARPEAHDGIQARDVCKRQMSAEGKATSNARSAPDLDSAAAEA